ncbi:extensin-2-like [Lingula anatina]|uniref:Extensin-2-like n=1 Tax=Lingula anatina TaxID=7574 RepID=A0A1S3H5U4_LINAN|nr:extensin-2-like [Lingula anatina]|eukprot:XP_013380499.1 extensin-2-like [Lingula anatina]
MAQPMTTFPEAYPQQNPHYGYDQGPPPAYNPAPSAPQTQLGSMAQPMTTFPEAYPQQNPHYGYDQGPPPAYNPAPSAPQTQLGSMAQPMTTFPEAYPQQNPHYGYDQGPPAYNPAPSAPKTQRGSMAQPMRTFPEAYPQQNPHYGYDQGPPAYNPAPSAPKTQVVVNQPAPATTNTVFVRPRVKPPNYMGLSISVLVMVNPLFGTIALIFSMLSDCDYGSGDVEGARSKGKIALWLNIIGMVTSIIVTVVAIVWYFVEIGAVSDSIYDET